MKIGGVSPLGRVAALPDSPVNLRLDAVRRGLRQHGAVIVNPKNDIDREVISRLRKLHGSGNVHVSRTNNAKLTVSNFKS
jgi:hypothetical protein